MRPSDMLEVAPPPTVPPDPSSALGRVLGHLTACADDGSTDRCGAAALGFGVIKYAKLRGRLVALGWVQPSGRQIAQKSGRLVTVWVVVKARSGLNPAPTGGDQGEGLAPAGGAAARGSKGL